MNKRTLPARIRVGILVGSLCLAGTGVAIGVLSAGTADATKPPKRPSLEAMPGHAAWQEIVKAKLTEAHRPVAKTSPRDTVAAAKTIAAYPDDGVTITAAAPGASAQASASAMSSSRQAISSLRALPSARMFGAALTQGRPVAALATVTEEDPTSPGVVAGTPYTAWVVNMHGPETYTGPPPAPASNADCNDVAIYDVQLSEWTTFLQVC